MSTEGGEGATSPEERLRERIRQTLDYLAVRDELPSDPDLMVILATHDAEIAREAARLYIRA